MNNNKNFGLSFGNPIFFFYLCKKLKIMKNIVIKVQSVSDIITNSSTEVFMVYNEDSLKQIKELVNAILDLGGNTERFDDLFECEITFDKERLLDEYPEYEVLTEDELLEKAYEYDDENSYEGYPVVDGYVIKAKNPKDEKLAKKLSEIDKIFDAYASYC